MKIGNLAILGVDDLVKLFARIGEQQHQSLEMFNTRQYNYLFKQMMAVKEELKSRKGDQRRELIKLFAHPNIQVRLAAAKATLAIAPAEARHVLIAIAELNWNPQSGDAGMCLALLDDGTFKPH